MLFLSSKLAHHLHQQEPQKSLTLDFFLKFAGVGFKSTLVRVRGQFEGDMRNCCLLVGDSPIELGRHYGGFVKSKPNTSYIINLLTIYPFHQAKLTCLLPS